MEPTITIRGHVGNEPEQVIVGDTSKVTFRLANTHRFRRSSDGQWEDAPTTWLTIECWRQLAANVLASVRLGHPVVVVGRLRTHEWESDGEKRSRVVVQADVVGHDLNRGRSVYNRVSKQGAYPERNDDTCDAIDDASQEVSTPVAAVA